MLMWPSRVSKTPVGIPVGWLLPACGGTSPLINQREEDPGAQIRDGNADAHRSLPGDSRDRHQAAHALGDLVDARAIAVRPGLAEARDAAVDQPRVDGTQALVIDPQARLHVGAIVLDHDVRVPDQALEDRHALGLSQIQRHALLVAMQVLEVEAVAIPAHAVAAATAGHLDLDGVRAPVHELTHARRARARAREVEDVEPGEGQVVIRHGEVLRYWAGL